MSIKFRKAMAEDLPIIWDIIKAAIARRKADGSLQWQDGYPNEEVIAKDIFNNNGYVLYEDKDIIGYCAILINDEPAYENIDGKWLSNGNFVVFHRVAIGPQYLGKGMAKLMVQYVEDFALKNNINSVKVDTNYDNLPMMAVFTKSGYSYCGEVFFRGSARRAYEKVLI